MLIGLATLADQLGAIWFVISLAVTSVAWVAWVAAWVVALTFALLLGTFALLWIVMFKLIWLSAFWHWGMNQFGQAPPPYDFWEDLRSIDDECYDPIMRSRASMRYEAKDAS
jgi:hypothetical protein